MTTTNYTTKDLVHKLTVSADWDASAGRYAHVLDIYESWEGRLRVTLTKDGKTVSKTFRDCETQHHDSERWLNDKMGYPNTFAGILSMREWE